MSGGKKRNRRKARMLPPSTLHEGNTHSNKPKEGPPETLTTPTRNKLIALFLDAMVGLALAFVPLSVVWKWIIFWFCFIAFVVIVMTFEKVKEYSVRARIVVSLMIITIFTGIALPKAMSEWYKEKSEALTGYISARHPSYHQPGTPITVEIGNSGIKLQWSDKVPDFPFTKFVYDAGLRIEEGDDGIEITTPIRDRSGQIVAQINKNHWWVAPFPECWDKNYSDDSLEVLDKRGHVVFQVRILSDRLQLRGEWRDDLGHGQRIMECSDPEGRIVGCIKIWTDQEQERKMEQAIPPIFLYPSKEHWGQLLGSSE